MAKSDGLGPNQRKWLKALESGKFKQDKAVLKTASGSYCCLGVACEVFKTPTVKVTFDEEADCAGAWKFNGEYEVAPPFVRRALGLRSEEGDPKDGGDPLTDINDSGKPFKKIAAIIRANPSNYFRSAK